LSGLITAGANTAIQEIRNLWTLLFPEGVTPPDEQQLTMWLLLHDKETVKRGIAHLAAKYKQLNGQMGSSYRVKFGSSVMNRIERELRQAMLASDENLSQESHVQ
jgi:hypothetical protein